MAEYKARYSSESELPGDEVKAKDLYVEKDGKWQLDVEGDGDDFQVGSVKGLKKTVDDLRKDVSRRDSQIETFESILPEGTTAEQLRTKLAEAEDLKSKTPDTAATEEQQAKEDSLNKQLEAMTALYTTTSLSAAAINSGVNPALAVAFVGMLKDRVKYEFDAEKGVFNSKFLDANGAEMSDTDDDGKHRLFTEALFFDGLKSSGDYDAFFLNPTKSGSGLSSTDSTSVDTKLNLGGGASEDTGGRIVIKKDSAVKIRNALRKDGTLNSPPETEPESA